MTILYVHLGLWARQHLRSLASVMKDDDDDDDDDDSDGQIIFGDLGRLKLPDICLTGEEKPNNKSVLNGFIFFRFSSSDFL